MSVRARQRSVLRTGSSLIAVTSSPPLDLRIAAAVFVDRDLPRIARGAGSGRSARRTARQPSRDCTLGRSTFPNRRTASRAPAARRATFSSSVSADASKVATIAAHTAAQVSRRRWPTRTTSSPLPSAPTYWMKVSANACAVTTKSLARSFAAVTRCCHIVGFSSEDMPPGANSGPFDLPPELNARRSGDRSLVGSRLARMLTRLACKRSSAGAVFAGVGLGLQGLALISEGG